MIGKTLKNPSTLKQNVFQDSMTQILGETTTVATSEALVHPRRSIRPGRYWSPPGSHGSRLKTSKYRSLTATGCVGGHGAAPQGLCKCGCTKTKKFTTFSPWAAAGSIHEKPAPILDCRWVWRVGVKLSDEHFQPLQRYYWVARWPGIWFLCQPELRSSLCTKPIFGWCIDPVHNES